MKKAPQPQGRPDLPLDDHIPALPVPSEPDDPPFLRRMKELIYHWVQEEWSLTQSIKSDIAQAQTSPMKRTMLPLLTSALKDAKLNTVNLARRLDNMSSSALHKELTSYGTPTPGRIIREARLAFAKHLLVHSRFNIADIVDRAGYRDQDHFCSIFKKATQMTPNQFRSHTRQELARAYQRNRTP
jgi:AraC-like DNA-binding protein